MLVSIKDGASVYLPQNHNVDRHRKTKTVVADDASYESRQDSRLKVSPISLPH